MNAIRRLKLLAKMFVLLAVVYLSLTLISGLVLYFVSPENFSPYYSVIVVFYWIIGAVLNYLLHRSRHRGGTAMINVFMLLRMIKFVLTIAFLLIGVELLNYPKLAFSISLVVNYFVCTGVELYLFYKYNSMIANNAVKK